ncbi:DEAD/DEAH box helicase [uncultured Muribaculum sp.]|uniref:DEAD/DEAH box helicase n=1 Tax=uncultured Muribaculum sp. TaxID=1918613 RepID=UPI00266EB68F|nr:DEAD/DEAH box helicase [uncultured Muribaculum sp.]
MKYNPYDYQKRAIQFVLDNPECLLALDMGLGKSSITLTALQELIDECEISRALVVAPKKVAETTWTTEAAKWNHLQGMTVAKVMGTEKQRKIALAEKADIYVIGRDNFVWLVGLYGGQLPFDVLVIDELTSFKNSKSQRFKAMRIARPSIKRVIGLTGTPAPNGLIDLWGQMYCIDMGQRLGRSVSKYRESHFESHRWNNIVVRCDVKKGHEDIIRNSIADICLSMQAKDYLQLPDLLIHNVPVELSPATMSAYNKFEREKVLEFEQEHEGEPTNILANSAAGLMNKLAQFANGAVYDDERNIHEIHSEKVDKLAEIVEGANGSSVLVFYQFKHDIPRIIKKLKGYRVEFYDGEKQLLDWNAGKIDVLLAHPASTAYGLNMQQGGHYIVWFGTGWDLELFQQANARLHRQGQRHPVTVYKLIGANTVDERASAALENKKVKQQSLLDSLNYLIRKHTNG